MSKITIAGNASGTGTFTVASPDTNVNRTLTLPDQTGTLATTTDVAAAGGMTLLGTISTGSQTVSGLTLTSYKQLFFDFNGLSHNNGTATNVSIGAGQVHADVAGTDLLVGGVWVSLWTGIAMSILTKNGSSFPASPSGQMAQTGYTNGTTSVEVSFAAGTVDAGSVRVYGVK